MNYLCLDHEVMLILKGSYGPTLGCPVDDCGNLLDLGHGYYQRWVGNVGPEQ